MPLDFRNGFQHRAAEKFMGCRIVDCAGLPRLTSFRSPPFGYRFTTLPSTSMLREPMFLSPSVGLAAILPNTSAERLPLASMATHPSCSLGNCSDSVAIPRPLCHRTRGSTPRVRVSLVALSCDCFGACLVHRGFVRRPSRARALRPGLGAPESQPLARKSKLVGGELAEPTWPQIAIWNVTRQSPDMCFSRRPWFMREFVAEVGVVGSAQSWLTGA